MSRIVIDRTPEGIATVVLSRPDRRNAIDWDMLTALARTSRELKRDRSLRAVILRGEGQSFCSGLDFPRMTKVPHRLAQAFFTPATGKSNLFQEACWGLRDLPVPVIAALHGHCFGGGMQIALAADFRFATPGCQLSVMEAKWGLIPDMSGTVALRELVGIDQAKLLTYTGRVIDGEEAYRIGLVTEATADPLAMAQEIAAEIVTRSPDSVAAGKRLLQDNWVADERSALARERRMQLLVMAGRNFREAMRANFDKVAPRFTKRSPLL